LARRRGGTDGGVVVDVRGSLNVFDDDANVIETTITVEKRAKSRDVSTK